MDNDKTLLWLFLVMALMSDMKPFKPPTNEEICEVISNKIETYLRDNKTLVEKAAYNSPIGHINALLIASKKIEDPDTRVEILSVAASILSNIEQMNEYCCGGA